MKKFNSYSKKLSSTILFSLLATLAIEGNAQQEKTWSFKVSLDEREIGYHEYRIMSDQGSHWVRSEASFDVKFLFFTAYEYHHTAEEFWQGECIKSLSSQTDDNGSALYLEAIAQEDELLVTNEKGNQQLSGCVRSFAYWDKDLLKASHLLNSQNGEYMPVDLIEKGETQLEIDGDMIPAMQYTLQMEEADINLWYTPDGDWLSLQTDTENGYTLTYMRNYQRLM